MNRYEKKIKNKHEIFLDRVTRVFGLVVIKSYPLIVNEICCGIDAVLIEPRREKTCFLHM